VILAAHHAETAYHEDDSKTRERANGSVAVGLVLRNYAGVE
jgi:hypothetical protein